MKKTILIITMACMATYASLGQIDSFITACYENSEFTGTVLVAKGGRVILNKNYGGQNEIFNIASITKTFTAALVLKLKIDVNDPLSKYYPGFPNGHKITVHHLLTHTSGIPDYVHDAGFQKSDQTKATTVDSMIAWFKNKALQFEPGTQFSYSNSGYTLLGYIIEKVTGSTYAQALQKMIFTPLQLTHTSYGPPATGVATGYGMYYKNFKKQVPPVHPSVSYATGAIYSTVNDLYKWHLALQGTEFLSQKAKDAAYTKDKGPYGYGWFTDTVYGKQRVSHDGNIPGYKSNINRFPQDDICVIALSNANNSGVGGMVRNIVNILYGQPRLKTFSELPAIELSDSLKQQFTGTYRFSDADSAIIRVGLRNHMLVVKIPGREEFPVEPVSKNAFRAPKIRVEFMRNHILIYSGGDFLGGGKVE